MAVRQLFKPLSEAALLSLDGFKRRREPLAGAGVARC